MRASSSAPIIPRVSGVSSEWSENAWQLGERLVEGQRGHRTPARSSGRWGSTAQTSNPRASARVGERAADPPEADDAEPRAALAQRPGDGWSQPALAHAAVESDDPAQEREEERERAVRHLLDAVVGDVADPDVALGGCARSTWS